MCHKPCLLPVGRILAVAELGGRALRSFGQATSTRVAKAASAAAAAFSRNANSTGGVSVEKMAADVSAHGKDSSAHRKDGSAHGKSGSIQRKSGGIITLNGGSPVKQPQVCWLAGHVSCWICTGMLCTSSCITTVVARVPLLYTGCIRV